MENKFTVRVMYLAKYMLEKGAICIGAHICDKGYIEFEFERTPLTIELYKEARKYAKKLNNK